MKTIKTLTIAILIVGLSSPVVAQAAWWKPSSWFRKSAPERVEVRTPELNKNENENEKETVKIVPPKNISQAPADTSLKLKIGQVYEARGMKAVVTEVIEDSRCPINARCISAGTVKIKVRGSYKFLKKSVVLTLNEPYSYSGYSATLIGVSPDKTTSETIAPRDYIFYFNIKKPETADTTPVQENSYMTKVAQCLKKNDVQFFGAYWCSHCQAQKSLFGTAAKLLPYVECSTADGKGQLQVCMDNNITGYPTWKFSNGEILTGEQTIENLAQKANCQI